MEQIKIIIAYSHPAVAFVEQFGFLALTEYKGGRLKRGEDFEVKEFPNEEIFKWYMKGLEDGKTWANPKFTIVGDNLINETPQKIKVLLVNPTIKTVTEHEILPTIKEFCNLLGCEEEKLDKDFPFKGVSVEVVIKNKFSESNEAFKILDTSKIIIGSAIIIKSNGFGGYTSTDFSIESLLKIVKVVKNE
jgi:hypothetical protein